MNLQNQKETKKNNFLKAIGYIFLFYFIEIIILFGLYIFSSNEILTNNIMTILMMIILFIKYKKDIINNAKSYKSDITNHGKRVILTYIVCLLLMFLTNNIIYNIIGELASNETSIRELFFKNPIPMFFNICLLTPFVEEIIFRQTFKDTHKNKKLTMFVCPIIFAVFHLLVSTNLLEVLYIIPYYLLGFACSYSYFKTDNILVSTTIHILHNSLNVMLICLL